MVGRHSGKDIVLYHHHSMLLCIGLPCYTIGQKTELSLGSVSYYVAKKNCHTNEIIVVRSHRMYAKTNLLYILYVCIFVWFTGSCIPIIWTCNKWYVGRTHSTEFFNHYIQYRQLNDKRFCHIKNSSLQCLASLSNLNAASNICRIILPIILSVRLKIVYLRNCWIKYFGNPTKDKFHLQLADWLFSTACCHCCEMDHDENKNSRLIEVVWLAHYL